VSLFKFLFKYRLKFRRFLYQNRYLIERMYSTAWFLMFFNIILTLIIRNRFSEAMLVIISICFFLIAFIRSLNKMTTSLRSFLLDSIFLELISVVVLFDIFNKIAHLGNNLYDFIIQYVLIVLAITISWSIVSCMANNKVATLANIILSTAIGLMIYIKDAIFDVLPDSLFQKYDSSDFLISIGYTPKGIVQAALNYAFLPFLISNIIAALICEIKGYWIDKYNDGKDITMEMIKEDINEKEVHSSNESVEKSREKLEQTQANIKMQMNIIDNLLARGFKLSEALELAELDEEVYNKFKAEK
jgi:hypothetical protein